MPTDVDHMLDQVEAELFESMPDVPAAADVPMVFILGAPRTGSTLLYQVAVNAFEVFYFDNLVNDRFAAHPLVGAALRQALPTTPVGYESRYGKTAQPHEPSEASAILSGWFPGDHPAQTVSAAPRPERIDHLLMTMRGIHALTGRPIVVKNAWNCFRIESLVGLFPRACFVWIRRDLVACAVSDLESRYRRGSPQTWNSATTWNYERLQTRPYWEQVVEQQYEYNYAIGTGLAQHAPDRHATLWYEDLCAAPARAVDELRRCFDATGLDCVARPAPLPDFARSSGPTGLADDRARIDAYAEACGARLEPFRHADAASPAPRP